MKNNISFILVMLFIFCRIQTLQAQSDYKTVQNFNEKVQQIEHSIKNADSVATLDRIEESITYLNNDYASNKELLDKSLYPDNFDGIIEQLKNSAELRKKDFTQIDVLHTEIAKLNTQLDTLNQRNNELAKQFALLESENKENIDRLEKIISQLRIDLQRRDQIVMSMIDNILPSSYKEGGEPNPMEKQKLMSKAEKENLLVHIKKAIDDNIRFLEATTLYPGDLNKIKAQQEKFVQIWKNVGSELAKVYTGKRKDLTNLNEIDQDFALWNLKINNEAWDSMNNEFADHQINFTPFTNGGEFTASVISFIDDAIKNTDKNGKVGSENLYKNFVDNIWNENIGNAWIPFLLENKMLSREQKAMMEAKMASWNNAIHPVGFNWIYIILVVFLVAIIVLLFELRSSRKAVKGYRVQGQNT